MPVFILAAKAFLKAYWKYILAALVVIASYVFVYNMGSTACDEDWKKTYNEKVRTLNEAINTLEKDSIRLAGENKADLAAAHARIESLLNNYQPSKTCTGETLTLSPAFVKTWNAISLEANGVKK